MTITTEAEVSCDVEQLRWDGWARNMSPELVVDWVLRQFGKQKDPVTRPLPAICQREDRPAIDLGGDSSQVLLGEEGFVEKLTRYVKRYEEIAEILRRQRYLSRPKLTKLFDGRLTKPSEIPLRLAA